MKRICKSTWLLILGIAIFLIGCIQPARYEAAKENGYEVDAVVVEVEKKRESANSTAYILYADYEVNGKQYEHIKIGKYYDSDNDYVGKTMKIVVDPNKPDSTMFEGGILCVIGFLMICTALVRKAQKRKKAKCKCQQPEQPAEEPADS